jgi:hypothetical protein
LINEGSTVTLTASATDSDVPPQHLTFSLDAPIPDGATIDPDTGLFSWTPPITDRSTTNAVLVRVSDGATNGITSFTVVVIARPRLLSMDESNGTVTLTWSVLPGVTYRAQYKDNLPDASWTDLGANVTASAETLLASDDPGTNTFRFYRLLQISPP